MAVKRVKPPKIAGWVFSRFADSVEKSTISGDLEEYFFEVVQEKGRLRAQLWFWKQILCSSIMLFKNSIYWGGVMFKNYLIIALRNMKKNKGFAFINIAGLAIGLTIFALLSLYIQFELSYDRFHINNDRMYRVEQILDQGTYKEPDVGCPTPLSQVLVTDFPEIEEVSRVIQGGSGLFRTDQDLTLRVRDIFFVDNSFFKIFTFPLQKGNQETVLNDLYSIVITEKLARSLFGDEDPLEKTIQADWGADLKVDGVVSEVPANSHIEFDMLVSASTLEALNGEATFTRWFDNWVPVYILLRPDKSSEALDEKLRFMLKKYQGERSKNELYLRPVSKIHLYSHINHEIGVNGSIKNVYIFSAIALFVLIIACINFINLTTARSTDRSREVGLRKVSGAHKSSLMRQFIGESVMIAIIAMILAVVLLSILLPEFNRIVNRDLRVDFIGNWLFSLGLIAVTLLVGGLSGIYPAVVLSSFQPVRVLKGRISSGGRNTILRKSLVVLQFFISVALIIGTVVILQQVNYLLHKDLGYNSEQVLAIPIGSATQQSKIDAFRNEILRNQNVVNAGNSDYMPYSSTNWTRVTWEGATEGELMKVNVNYVDENLISTYGMTIVKGRGFSKNMRSSDENEVIINETAAKRIGWKEPIGKRILYNVDYRSRTVGGATVVGIVKDYHFLSLHNTITPLMMRLIHQEDYGSTMSVKISTQDIPGTLGFIENKFAEVFPEKVFSFRFLDEDFRQMYLEEQKAGRVIFYLAVLAICIACLGLFGLASYATKQRTKEIGIRKIIGASVTNITVLLTKEFVWLMSLANLLAWPVAYYGMRQWLQNFPYRIDIQFWVFIASGVGALLIALATVFFQSIKAALANPADSLRYE